MRNDENCAAKCRKRRQAEEQGEKEEEHRVRDERTTLTYFNSQTAFA